MKLVIKDERKRKRFDTSIKRKILKWRGDGTGAKRKVAEYGGILELYSVSYF